VDKVFPMAISKGHRLPDIMDEVRIIGTLLDRPKVHAGRRSAGRAKNRAFTVHETERPDEVESDVGAWGQANISLQHNEAPFAKPPNNH
jgi:hypothetical protein